MHTFEGGGQNRLSRSKSKKLSLIKKFLNVILNKIGFWNFKKVQNWSSQEFCTLLIFQNSKNRLSRSKSKKFSLIKKFLNVILNNIGFWNSQKVQKWSSQGFCTLFLGGGPISAIGTEPNFFISENFFDFDLQSRFFEFCTKKIKSVQNPWELQFWTFWEF